MAEQPHSGRHARRVQMGPRGPVQVVGLKRPVFTDLYYFLIERSWLTFFLVVALVYIALNATYALLYLAGGPCLANARPGVFWDAFFFSVQTLATIGYGFIYPTCFYTNILVTTESLLGLIGIAVVTGITFNKFARPRARVQFSRHAVVTQHEGRPTLMFRVANERANYVAEATLSVTLVTTGPTAEGRSFTRMKDVGLVRHRSPMFVLTWTALHIIDEASPLWGLTHAQLVAMRASLVCTLTGYDATLGQTIHSRHQYHAEDLRWSHQLRDILTPAAQGQALLVNYTFFHDVVAEAENP